MLKPSLSIASSRGCGTRGLRSTTTKTNALLLILSSFIMLGLYYLITMPASVRQHLKETMGGGSKSDFEAKFQLTFTLIFVPNIFLPFFAGGVVDRIGARTCLLALSIICFFGQVVASIGVEYENWTALLIGRFIFGIGFESLFVANEAFLTSIFEDQLGIALGFSSAASYIGYLLSPILSPIAAGEINVAFAFWIGAMFLGLSVLASFAIFAIAPSKKNVVNPVGDESIGAAMEAVKEDECIDKEIGDNTLLESDPGRDTRRIQLSQIRHLGLSFWLLCVSCAVNYGTVTAFAGIASGLLLEQYMFRDLPQDCEPIRPNECNSGYLVPDILSCSGNNVMCPTSDGFAPSLPRSINVTALENHFWDNPVYTFSHLTPDDVDCTDNFWSEACTEEYCETQSSVTKKAGIMMSIPFIVTVLTTFLFGHYGVDRAKLRLPMVALAPILSLVAHALFVFGGFPPIIPLIILGFGFSTYVASLWPSVALAVPEKEVGTAYGIITCIQAIGNALMPMMVTVVYNRTGQRYAPGVEIFFLSCSVVGVLVGISLMRVDRWRVRPT